MFKHHKIIGICLTLALLRAGTAKAELLNTSADCFVFDQVNFLCAHANGDLLDRVFTVSELGGVADPLYGITADPTSIMLTFVGGVTGNDLEGTSGFELDKIQNTDGLPIEIVDVDYRGDFSSVALSEPTVENY